MPDACQARGSANDRSASQVRSEVCTRPRDRGDQEINKRIAARRRARRPQLRDRKQMDPLADKRLRVMRRSRLWRCLVRPGRAPWFHWGIARGATVNRRDFSVPRQGHRASKDFVRVADAKRGFRARTSKPDPRPRSRTRRSTLRDLFVGKGEAKRKAIVARGAQQRTAGPRLAKGGNGPCAFLQCRTRTRRSGAMPKTLGSLAGQEPERKARRPEARPALDVARPVGMITHYRAPADERRAKLEGIIENRARRPFDVGAQNHEVLPAPSSRRTDGRPARTHVLPGPSERQ